MKNSKDFSYIWSCFRLKILGTSTIQRFYVPEESRIFHCLLSSPLILAFFFKYDQIARLNLFGCRAAFRQRAWHGDRVSIVENEDGKFNQPQNSFLSYRNSFFFSARESGMDDGSRLRCVRSIVEPRSRLPTELRFFQVGVFTDVNTKPRKATRLLATRPGEIRGEEITRTGYSRWMITRQCDLLPDDSPVLLHDGPTEKQKPANLFHSLTRVSPPNEN